MFVSFPVDVVLLLAFELFVFLLALVRNLSRFSDTDNLLLGVSKKLFILSELPVVLPVLLLSKWRETLINLDQMILDDLESLFMMIYLKGPYRSFYKYFSSNKDLIFLILLETVLSLIFCNFAISLLL